jgi:hypothetical protein
MKAAVLVAHRTAVKAAVLLGQFTVARPLHTPIHLAVGPTVECLISSFLPSGTTVYQRVGTRTLMGFLLSNASFCMVISIALAASFHGITVPSGRYTQRHDAEIRTNSFRNGSLHRTCVRLTMPSDICRTNERKPARFVLVEAGSWSMTSVSIRDSVCTPSGFGSRFISSSLWRRAASRSVPQLLECPTF